MQLRARANQLEITGEPDDVAAAYKALTSLYERLKRGLTVEMADVDAAVRFARAGVMRRRGGHPHPQAAPSMRARPASASISRRCASATWCSRWDRRAAARPISPSPWGVSLLLAGKVERIVLSRPAVEAGERLGFLPGDMREKIDPYLRPLYDALHDMLPAELIAKRMEAGDIEIAPLAFMRGRTLSHCYVILDEAQNTTPMQMRMFLTRLGEGSRMIVTGDPSQTDLPGGQKSGLNDAVDTLSRIDGIRFVRLTSKDVVRHDLVTRIVEAYDARDRKIKG